MTRTFTIPRKLVVACSILALSTALYGCSSSSGGDGLDDDDDELVTVDLLPFATHTGPRADGLVKAMVTATPDNVIAVTTNSEDSDSATKVHIVQIDANEQGIPTIDAGNRPVAQQLKDVGEAPAASGLTGRVFRRPLPQGGTQELVVYTDRKATPSGGQADDTYSVLGWWTNEPQAVDGTWYTSPFFVFGDAYVDEGLSEVTGTATYAGHAVGRFGLRPVSETGISIRSGPFTATANLTANFDTGELGGSITNFRDQEGSAIPGWMLRLNPMNLEEGWPYRGDISGTGPAAGVSWRGIWSALFTDGVTTSPFVPSGHQPELLMGFLNARYGKREVTDSTYVVLIGAYTAERQTR